MSLVQTKSYQTTQKLLLSSHDARTWAQVWLGIISDHSEDEETMLGWFMLGWFANAMAMGEMRGYQQALEEVEGAIPKSFNRFIKELEGEQLHKGVIASLRWHGWRGLSWLGLCRFAALRRCAAGAKLTRPTQPRQTNLQSREKQACRQ